MMCEVVDYPSSILTPPVVDTTYEEVYRVKILLERVPWYGIASSTRVLAVRTLSTRVRPTYVLWL